MKYLTLKYWELIIETKKYTFLESLSMVLIGMGLSSLSTIYTQVPKESLSIAIFVLSIGIILYIKEVIEGFSHE